MKSKFHNFLVSQNFIYYWCYFSLENTYRGYISNFNESYEKVFNSDEIATGGGEDKTTEL